MSVDDAGFPKAAEKREMIAHLARFDRPADPLAS